jgi:threonine/homoserine/homoserine lactone efflux protein
MDMQKVLTYASIAVAAIVSLIFILDAAAGILGRNILLDILFILGGAFVIWQGIETARELK